MFADGSHQEAGIQEKVMVRETGGQGMEEGNPRGGEQIELSLQQEEECLVTEKGRRKRE